MRQDTALCWLRRDLRLQDHAALHYALSTHARVLCVFVFDDEILTPLARADRRVEFIWHALAQLKAELNRHGSDVLVVRGAAVQQIAALSRRFAAEAVYASADAEPAARRRDQQCAQALEDMGSHLVLVKDQVIFAAHEILGKSGAPYRVFTPYKNNWLARQHAGDAEPYQTESLFAHLLPLDATPMPPLSELGFLSTDLTVLGVALAEAGGQALLSAFAAHIADYQQWRDYPARDASSHLSVHLRFGTISVRAALRLALAQPGPGASCWLNELIWREFYQQLLWHHPNVADESFKPQYRALAYENRTDWFAAWCAGQTGYPLVDAAMRQLAQTGWMHNRLRMLCASFLVKDLLIDWRWGERHFAAHLLDYDLAANNGGWQWSASTGCDAQPWFRIFNPITQSQRFDPDGEFIRHYVPELAAFGAREIHAPWLARRLPHGWQIGRDYPPPLVEHARQRERALELFGRAG